MASPGRLALPVRLDEPEVLVDVARDLGEDVGGVGVAGLVGLVDRGAHLLAESREGVESASTWSLPLHDVERVSRSDVRFAVACTVPSAVPPSWTIRSAIRSTHSSADSLILSKSSWRAMKFGPLTFQWACLVCSIRSVASASRSPSNATTFWRTLPGKSFFVRCMIPPAPRSATRPGAAMSKRPRILSPCGALTNRRTRHILSRR